MSLFSLDFGYLAIRIIVILESVYAVTEFKDLRELIIGNIDRLIDWTV